MIDTWQPGSTVVTQDRTITERDVVLFAALTGDWNPLHTDAEYARTTAFGERVAHGLLSLTVAVGLLLDDSAWPDAAVVRELRNIRFVRPVHFGDTLHLTAEVLDVTPGVATLRFQVLNQTGDAAIMGRMLVGIGDG